MRNALRHPILLALGLVLAVALPITFSSSGAEVNDACGAQQSTCCKDFNSACSGVGAGWYDTGYCGPCDHLHQCP